MKNTLGDLNNHLFAQLDRLSDKELKGEKLQEEISKAKAVGDIAARIIANGSLVLNAMKFKDDMWNADAKLPVMLEGVLDRPGKKKKKMPKEIRSEFTRGM